jgi:hypothetical protein
MPGMRRRSARRSPDHALRARSDRQAHKAWTACRHAEEQGSIRFQAFQAIGDTALVGSCGSVARERPGVGLRYAQREITAHRLIKRWAEDSLAQFLELQVKVAVLRIEGQKVSYDKYVIVTALR